MVLTNVGRKLLAGFLNNETVTRPTHIAVGTGTTTPSLKDTQLVTESARYALDTAFRLDNNRIRLDATVPSGELNGQTLSEIGVFNAASAGDCYARITVADLAKTTEVVKITVILNIR